MKAGEEGDEIPVDLNQPPTMTFDEVGGDHFLSYDTEIGWVLNKRDYHPLVLEVYEFGAVSEALNKAQALLTKPLNESGLVWSGRVNLLRDWGEPGGTSSFLAAYLESNGTLPIYGQNLGRTVVRDGEYEYWYGIKAEHVPALLVALGGIPGQNILAVLEQHWSGDAAKGLETAIRNSGVEYRFINYF